MCAVQGLIRTRWKREPCRKGRKFVSRSIIRTAEPPTGVSLSGGQFRRRFSLLLFLRAARKFASPLPARAEVMDECYGRPARYQNFFTFHQHLFTFLDRNQSLPAIFMTEMKIQIAIVAFSVLLLLLNIVTLITLFHPDVTRDQPTFRKHMILLTGSEVLFTFFNANYFIWRAVLLHIPCGVACPILLTAMVVCAQTSESYRNWCVTLVSVARCEAIIRPIKSRVSGQILTAARLYLVSALLGCFLLTMALFEKFNPRSEVSCLSVESNVTQIWRTSDLTVVRSVVFFFIFRGLPVIIVFTASGFILATLCTKRQAASGPQTNTTVASKTVAVLAVSFGVLECSGFFLMLRLLEGQKSATAYLWVYYFDKFLVTFNSMSYIFAFIHFNPSFKHGFCETLRRVTCIPARQIHPQPGETGNI